VENRGGTVNSMKGGGQQKTQGAARETIQEKKVFGVKCGGKGKNFRGLRGSSGAKRLFPKNTKNRKKRRGIGPRQQKKRKKVA